MIYFVRHGESEGNVIVASGAMISPIEHRDLPLTELGREQAENTAKELRDVNIDIVVTSGLKRAIETAEIINRYHGAPTVRKEGLNEREDRRALVEGRDEEWAKSWDFEYDADPGIEDLGEFRDRVLKALREVEAEYRDKNILMVAHGGVSHVLRRYFEGGKWEGNIRMVRLRNAEVIEFDF